MWAFAASPDELGLTSDLLQQTPQESVPASSNEISYDIDQCWIPRGNQDAQEALFDKIKNSKAGMDALRCWLVPSEDEKTLEFVKGTDTSLAYPEAWQQNWDETYYDRVGQVHCNEWSFKKGDNYTIVAINGLRDELAGLGKPNLQHIGFKLEYETFGDVIGPNLEVFAPYDQGFTSPEKELKANYKLPLSYINCFTNGMDPALCSAEGRNAFAEWWYAYVNGGDWPEPCEDSECPAKKLKMMSQKASQVLKEDYNISNAYAEIHDQTTARGLYPNIS
jgi:hypothetical protein